VSVENVCGKCGLKSKAFMIQDCTTSTGFRCDQCSDVAVETRDIMREVVDRLGEALCGTTQRSADAPTLALALAACVDGLRREALVVQCSGLGEAVWRTGAPPPVSAAYDMEHQARMRLADQAGALADENRALLVENATLRRQLERTKR
jgi:hypothetical protein